MPKSSQVRYSHDEAAKASHSGLNFGAPRSGLLPNTSTALSPWAPLFSAALPALVADITPS
eukprot:gene13175-30661_t